MLARYETVTSSGLPFDRGVSRYVSFAQSLELGWSFGAFSDYYVEGLCYSFAGSLGSLASYVVY